MDQARPAGVTGRPIMTHTPTMGLERQHRIGVRANSLRTSRSELRSRVVDTKTMPVDAEGTRAS